MPVVKLHNVDYLNVCLTIKSTVVRPRSGDCNPIAKKDDDVDVNI